VRTSCLKLTLRAIALLSVAGCGPRIPATAASPLPVLGVFVFSSLCFGSEDPAGGKIVLIRGAEGTTALYWRTEGALLAPLMAYGPDVKIDDHTGNIIMQFLDQELPADSGRYVLTGTLSAEALAIHSNVTGDQRLPRQLSEPARLPKCNR